MRPHRRFAATAVLSLAALGSLATSAGAVHWPLFGGDGGRSGHQPVGERLLRVPADLIYSRTADADQPVKTSIVASTGAPEAMRVVYGTAGGRIHLRVAATGTPVGPEGGVPIDDGAADADVLGGDAPASVTPAETSDASGLGQVFAVHNDDDQSVTTGDIALAQIDERDGALVQDVPLAGTGGFTVGSSALITEPQNERGDRMLFFVAESGDDERLFRVPITRAGARDAVIGAVTSTGDVDADPHASPTLVFLRDAGGQPKAYVAIGTGAPDSRVETYAVSDLAAGPVSPSLGGSVQTPSVPVLDDGTTPSPGSALTTAPAIYVASDRGGQTVVFRLEQQGNEQTLAQAARSDALAGAPAPALAVPDDP